MIYRVLADLVLYIHAGFVLFVVVGQVLILIGGIRGWGWVRSPVLRYAHLAAIAVVVAQSWLGMVCPLTTLENTLRHHAGGETYAGGFIAHWVHTALFYQAPLWVFTLIYSVFGATVVAAWFWVKPRRWRDRQ